MGGTFSDTHYYPLLLTSNPKCASPYPPGYRLVPLTTHLSLRPHTYPSALSPVLLPVHMCIYLLTCTPHFLIRTYALSSMFLFSHLYPVFSLVFCLLTTSPECGFLASFRKIEADILPQPEGKIFKMKRNA